MLPPSWPPASRLLFALALVACAPTPKPDPDAPDDTAAVDDTDDTDTDDTATTTPDVSYYLDCQAGDDTADGTTPESAWRSLARLAREPLGPGDAVWLAAGTACEGTLTLTGSGADGAPITVGAYGDGAPPIVRGTGEVAVHLADQSWITIEGLEITGSTVQGVYVTADTLVQGITLRDLEVHGVTGGPLTAKGTGLVVFTIGSVAGWFEDILVEDVVAWDTNQWSGIFLYGTAWRQGGPRSTGVTFRGNVVHDVYGDGIVAFGAEDALLEANLAYEIGLAPDDDIGTPNGIWTWDCVTCTVQFNEVYGAHSPGVDGGAFDIDYDNVDNVVQYNYGHHNDSYCVAVFAAEGTTTTGSVVRHNVCVDNGQAPDVAYAGDIFLYAWNGGILGDVQIYNNTVIRSDGYLAPYVLGESFRFHRGFRPRTGGVVAKPGFAVGFARASAGALVMWSEPGPGSGVWNNLFVVDHDWMATVMGRPEMSNNLWWSTAGGSAWFDDNAGGWYDGVTAWQAAGVESDSLAADPVFAGGEGKDAALLGAGSPAIDAGFVLASPGACDAFGNLLAGAPDIGAHAYGGVADASCVR